MVAAIECSLGQRSDTASVALLRALQPSPEAWPELLERRRLLRRVDTKFLLHVQDLDEIVARVARDYAALRVASGPVATYRSLYFDTPDLRCYHDHRRARRLRHKARVRHYPDRGLSFFEVKSKKNDRVTLKHRIEVPYGSERRSHLVQAFLSEQMGPIAGHLVPTAYVHYRRVSLLGLAASERVTIDFDIEVGPPGGPMHAFDGLAIIEVKQPTVQTSTPIMRALTDFGVKRRGLSKYVAAITTTHPTERKNRLLPSLRALERIIS